MAYLIVSEMGEERIVPLDEAETSLGRSRDNTIRLHAEESSRKHCTIVKNAEGFNLIDAGSSNGTCVNGARVKRHALRDGDVIAIGRTTIRFREGAPDASPAELVEGPTERIPFQDRSVQVLIDTILMAAQCEKREDFLPLALDNVIAITHAERGVFFAPHEDDLKPQIARARGKELIPHLADISRSIPRQVWSTRKAVYLLDTKESDDSVQSLSVSLYNLRTVMCAPLRIGEKMLGVLYVDSHAKTREYTATDLSLFEAVANYLALTLENLRHAEESKRTHEEHRRKLEEENARLRSALEERRHLIGECPEMKALYDTIRKVAPTDATTLILGESGTGKEAIAHVLHVLSPRSEKPFVVIDCAAIPETLLESELFGYERGAFTGAEARKPGKFEAATGGTLFLDEIAELSPNLQVKLLRALEQKTITRVGGIDPVHANVRLIAATNRNLEEMVKNGTFRQDLYFRMKVVTLHVPALRNRGEDILLLANHFLLEANEVNGREVKGFSEEAQKAMQAQKWEGNVRELKHRIEQAVILSNHLYLSTEDLNLTSPQGGFRALDEARDHFEKGYVLKALSQHRFNVTHAARGLGISRQHLQNLMKKHRLFKSSEAGEVNGGGRGP